MVEEDSWGMHFLRFVGLVVLFQVLSLIGTIWFMFALSQVGYRKRDLLLMLIPLFDIVLGTVAVWRYTALSAYWTPRLDRPSYPMSRGAMNIAAVIGWIVLIAGGLAATRYR